MSAMLKDVASRALELSSRERAELARRLIGSLDKDADAGVEVEWDREIARRVRRIKSGKATGRPAHTVLAEIRARYG
jgi:putative addiction module component (TIGR02574 family)